MRGSLFAETPPPYRRAACLDGLDVETVTVDVCDHEGMASALDGAAAYYHLAAIYKTWMENPEPMYRVNLEGTTTSLLAARRVGVKRVIYTSSIAAVGLREDGDTLRGRITGDMPILWLAIPEDVLPSDVLHEITLKLALDRPGSLAVDFPFRDPEKEDLLEALEA